MLPLYDFKHPRSPSREGRRIPLTFRIPKKWWSLSGSNRRPEACKATALPAELRPRFCLASVAGRDLRPLGYPRQRARRPVGLRKHVRTASEAPEINGGPGTTRTSDLTLI